MTIDPTEYSIEEVVLSTVESVAVDYAFGKVVPSLNVKNVTAGRNSYKAVFDSGITKLKRGSASKMSAKTIGKGIWANIVGDTYSSVTDGLLTHLQDISQYF